ncbi:hypothetical protein NRB20_20060 [Nocardia sp. RB20]|uniref:Uncharacterized protein n=1 Tax=Nocardia macrotermitis TaxID=2585198 RepID=A0A7K0D122_9NOCA|nr:hypothetical protein [Nocardia macrotermitis]
MRASDTSADGAHKDSPTPGHRPSIDESRPPHTGCHQHQLPTTSRASPQDLVGSVIHCAAIEKPSSTHDPAALLPDHVEAGRIAPPGINGVTVRAVCEKFCAAMEKSSFTPGTVELPPDRVGPGVLHRLAQCDVRVRVDHEKCCAAMEKSSSTRDAVDLLPDHFGAGRIAGTDRCDGASGSREVLCGNGKVIVHPRCRRPVVGPRRDWVHYLAWHKSV